MSCAEGRTGDRRSLSARLADRRGGDGERDAGIEQGGAERGDDRLDAHDRGEEAVQDAGIQATQIGQLTDAGTGTWLVRDGIRCDEVSLGYPREWSRDRAFDSFLREILPASNPDPDYLANKWRGDPFVR